MTSYFRLLASDLSMIPIPLTEPEQRQVRAALLRWFAAHRRSLPWRETRDPYRIWISEIMLQQTRVAAVFEHYAEFLRRFPDVQSLAAAKLPDVLAAWSGLGYYRRARALHQAARDVVRIHHGKLPESAEALASLPGIGRYTAAAIASIAFHQPCAVVDGNVERVLCRFFGWRGQSLSRIWGAAQQLLSRRSPGNFNQAIMELGALVCLPGRPRCDLCPVRKLCATVQVPDRLPHPCLAAESLPTNETRARDRVGKSSTSKLRPERKAAVTTYGLATRRERVYLVRRGARESLMPSMWELPQLSNGDGNAEVAPHLPGSDKCGSFTSDFTLRHSIT